MDASGVPLALLPIGPVRFKRLDSSSDEIRIRISCGRRRCETRQTDPQARGRVYSRLKVTARSLRNAKFVKRLRNGPAVIAIIRESRVSIRTRVV